MRHLLLLLPILGALTSLPVVVNAYCDDCGGPEAYKPVCAMDGQTYANACIAKCAAVPIKYEGKCAAQCTDYDVVNCNGNFESDRMVCSKGLTFFNAAEAMCEGEPIVGNCYQDRVCEYNIRDGKVVSQLNTPQGAGKSVKAAANNVKPLSSSNAPYDYSEALTKSLVYFDTQISGKITTKGHKRLEWRANSCQECVGKYGEDISGGFFEAGGSYLKFPVINAYMANQLAWAVLEFKDGFVKTNTYNDAMYKIRWAADYLVAAHVKPYVYMAINGKDDDDFDYFGPPEEYQKYVKPRPVGYITKENKGSEVLADSAAALAALSMILKEENKTADASKYLKKAVELYEWAITNPGSYNKNPDSIVKILRDCYASNGYIDELGWASMWLFRATKDKKYLAAAKSYHAQLKFKPVVDTIELNNKYVQLTILLSKNDPNNAEYQAAVKKVFDAYLEQKIFHTPRGLAQPYHWGSARFGADLCFLGFIHAKNPGVPDAYSNRLRNYGAFQINYLLGDSGRSWVVGFGEYWPKMIWHKASYNSYKEDYTKMSKKIYAIPDDGPWSSGVEGSQHPYIEKGKLDFEGSRFVQRHIAYGHLVSPLRNDNLVDTRKDYTYTESTIEYQSGFTGALAALSKWYKLGEYTGKMTEVLAKPK